MSHPVDKVVNRLKKGKHPRTQASLDKLHAILKQYGQAYHRDFSLTTIANVSADNGGPGYSSLVAKVSPHFRELVESWAEFYGVGIKKPLKSTSRSKHVSGDTQLLESIKNHETRAAVGKIITERNQYRAENIQLKKMNSIVIDRRTR